MTPSTYVGVSVFGLAMALTPLGQAFVTPGSSLLAAHGRVSLSRSSTKASPRTSCRMAEEETTEQVEEAEEAGDGEKSRTKAPTWMFNDNGVAYAPWMVDSFDPENLAKVAASIEARKLKEANTIPEALGALARDPQQMELSGTGVKAKRIGDNMVELMWTTGDEKGNLGFIVSRRAAKTEGWEEIASYENFPPLNSKGVSGGAYTYVDEEVELGTWVYRISDINKAGARSDLCQTLIELQSSSDALQTKIGVAGLAVALLIGIAAGTTIDPFAQ